MPSASARRAILLTLQCTIYFCATIALAADFEYEDTVISKIAFGSCHSSHKSTAESERLWKAVQAELPDAWLWTGDAVYPPRRGIASVELLKAEYQQLKTNTTLGYAPSLLRKTPTFGTWDDHDYGGNDCGNEMPDKESRAAAYWAFLGLEPPSAANDSSSPRQGVYYDVTWGRPPQQVQTVFLDTRWHRDPHCIPSVATLIPKLGTGIACVTRWLSAGLWPGWCQSESASVLGDEQWKWLEQTLSTSKASLLVVVSSVQVFTTNPVMESWGHFPNEQDHLLRLLAKASERAGVVVLSGDVHHGEILDPAAGTSFSGTSFLEVTSSGLTHDCSSPFYGVVCRPLLETFHRHRFHDSSNYYIGRNYGTISVNWSEQVFDVHVHNSDGNTVLRTGSRPFRTPAWESNDQERVAQCMDGHLIQPAVTALVLAIATLTLMLVRRKCH